MNLKKITDCKQLVRANTIHEYVLGTYLVINALYNYKLHAIIYLRRTYATFFSQGSLDGLGWLNSTTT